MPQSKAHLPSLTEDEQTVVELAIARAQYRAARQHISQENFKAQSRESILAAAVLELGQRLDQAEERLRAAEAELSDLRRPLILRLIRRLRRRGGS